MTSLERYLKAQDKIIAKDKEDLLIALGITEKEYSSDGSSSPLYSKYDYIMVKRDITVRLLPIFQMKSMLWC